MGAEVVTLIGTDVADTIAKFARERGVSLVIVGKSTRGPWHRLRRGSLVDRLVRGTSGLDVLVVSFDESQPASSDE